MKKLNSLNFNLREPHARRPTPIYAVVRIDSRQVKIPLGAKIEPWRWDKLRQIPILNGDKNYLFIFDTISRLRLLFAKNFLYVCNVDIISMIKKEINDMANPQNLRHSVTRTPKATTLLHRALDLYYAEKRVKENTIKETKKLLKSYYGYCLEVGKDKMSMLSQRGLNEYRDYLVRQRSSSNMRINAKCELIARLVNFMVGHSSFSRYKIQLVKYNQLEEYKAKGEDKLRRPLTEDEVKAVAECVGLTPHQNEYRDLFITQCECGCRASDLWRLFDQTQQVYYTHKGHNAFTINTQKEDIKAVIIQTAQLTEMQEKYKHGFRKINTKSGSFVSNYDAALKRIFRAAGLDTMEQYTDAYGVAQTKPLHVIINSHFGRYTFIRDCFEKGLNASEIKYLTGHADETMVNDVYLIITAKDKANNVFRAFERVKESHQSDNAVNEQQQSNALTDYVLRCRDILSWLGEPRANYVNISHPQELARLITAKYEVPLVNMGWTIETIERLYKDNDTEGYERLKADIMKLRPNSLNQ